VNTTIQTLSWHWLLKWKNCGVDQWKGMTPQIFEALLFLKVSEQFWNQTLVIEALRHATTARSKDCFAKIMEQLDIQGNNK
jgi:hypothetical protein